MSTASTAASATGRAAIKEADDGLGSWLKGIVTGQGSSVSQIIISGVLSVIPGVGQAMDARDPILGIIALSANPLNPWAWVDIIVTLVGLIPGFGDAFKVAFRFIRHGHPLGRVLDAVSPKLRGNVERWLKTADWGKLTAQVTGLFNDVIGQFIQVLEGWLVKAVMGRSETQRIVAQLKSLQNKAPAMLKEGMQELQKMHAKMMGDARPKSTQTKLPPNPPASKPTKQRQSLQVAQ